MQDGFIKTIKEKADIYNIINAVTPLKKAGAQYKGLCPFHGEKSPSFIVDTQQQTYHCYGCGAHGDVISFVQKQKQLTFVEALELLANQLGLEMPQLKPLSPQQKQEAIKQKEKKLSLLDIHEKLTIYYEKSLAVSTECQHYLQKRRISPEAVKAFRLGWANDDINAFVRWFIAENISIEALKEIGILAESQYGEPKLGGLSLRFKNRLMCPIFNQLDQVIAYSGRVISSESKLAKYVNSPETPLFTKGKNLYGLKTAKEGLKKAGHQSKLILCEGNLDVVSLWQEGFDYAVAPMGTALTIDQCEIIARLQAGQVICMMDGDKAGINASFKALPLLLQVNIQPKGILLSDGHDPDSFLKEPQGAQRLKALVEQAEPLLLICTKYLFDQTSKDIVAQYEIINQIKPFIEAIKIYPVKILYIDELIKILNCPEYVIYPLLNVKKPFISKKNKSNEGQKTNPSKLNPLHRSGRTEHQELIELINTILGPAFNSKSFSQKLSALDRRLSTGVNDNSSLYPLFMQLSNLEIEDSLQNQIKKNVLGEEKSEKIDPQDGQNGQQDQMDQKAKTIAELLKYLKPPKVQIHREMPSSLFDRICMIIQKPEYLKKFIELDGISELKENLVKEFLLELYRSFEEQGFFNADLFFSKHKQAQFPKEKELLDGLNTCMFHRYQADLSKQNMDEFLAQMVYTFKAEKIHDQMKQIQSKINDLSIVQTEDQFTLQEKIEISNQNPLNDFIDSNPVLSKEELLSQYELLKQEYREAINRSTHFSQKQR